MRYLKFLVVFLCTLCFAQSPSEVSRLSADGNHYKALLSFSALSKRKTTPESLVAAGKSAWALSLPNVAIEKLEEAIQLSEVKGLPITGVERAKIYAYRGIIQFQEDDYKGAVTYAEKAFNQLTTPSSLRGKVLLLWGESLERLSRCVEAEGKLTQSIDEVQDSESPNVSLSLARCKLQLGKADEAKNAFLSVPLNHERSWEAVRGLADVFVSVKDYKQASFWLEKGRELYPEQFLDSWVDYVLALGAIAENDQEKIKKIQNDAANKFGGSDYWFTLLNASVEAYFFGGA